MAETGTRIVREAAVAGQPVVDPADWTGAELAASDQWVHRLTDAEIADIDGAVRGVEERGLDIMEIAQENFPLPVFGPVLAGIREALLDGLGITLIKGFPIERYNRAQAAAAYFGMGCYLGRAVS